MPRAVLPELSGARARLFTTSLRYRAAAEPPINAGKPSRIPKNVPVPQSTSVAPSRYAFIKSLATKQTPTTLYEGPSHFWFYFGCWTSGVSILTWTALTGPTVMSQPEGTPEWVTWVFGATYILMGSMGAYLITKTPNIVSSIRVLPAQAAKLAPGPGAHTTPLQMEVTVQRMLPLLKPRVLTTSLENVSLKTRFSLPSEYVPELKRQEMQRAREVQLRKYDMEHLLTMPFRRLGRGLANMFTGVKAAWTDMGFGVMKVDGKQYKVDVTKGFAHDGFRTLERIVSIGEK